MGDGEGEVLGEEKFEQYLGELAFERFLGRDLRDLGASFFFPTPAGPLAESVSSFPLSSPWLSPLPSPAARVDEPPPHPDLLPSHSHWPHPRCQWHDIAHWAWGAVDILDVCWKGVLCPGKESNAAAPSYLVSDPVDSSEGKVSDLVDPHDWGSDTVGQNTVVAVGIVGLTDEERVVEFAGMNEVIVIGIVGSSGEVIETCVVNEV